MNAKRLGACLLVLATGTLTIAALRPAILRQDMPQPAEEHAMLQRDVGSWTGTLTIWMPGMPEMKSDATEVIESVGPFWTQSRFTCDFMGMPYLGTGCLGYDAEKKEFVGTWIDNMSSAFALMKGELDAETNSVVMHWSAPDMTGQVQPHRSVSVVDGDTRTSTFYVGEGEGTKSMVIEMKRVSKDAGAR